MVSPHLGLRTPVRALALGLALLAAACGGDGQDSSDEEVPLFHTPRRASVQAPDSFTARFETTKGSFSVRVLRAWAPLGADRFYSLVKAGYYSDNRLYRVVDNFMAQWGVHGDARVTTLWRRYAIADDPVVESNTRGRLTFAADGPNTRTVQVFVNLRDNPNLDRQGFAPIGEVIEGMDVIESFYSDYGDGPPRGDGPYQARALARGNLYLDADFPELDTVISATVVEE